MKATAFGKEATMTKMSIDFNFSASCIQGMATLATMACIDKKMRLDVNVSDIY